MTIKVMIVDDSALICSILTQIIESQDDMEVVAVAPDPYVARDLVKRHNPDVMTLDIEMPRMHGLEFLKRLMHGHPMPVVMISSLTAQNSEYTFQALELGAVDFFHKPQGLDQEALLNYADEIIEKVRAAAAARLKSPIAKKIAIQHQRREQSVELIAVGASTGGTDAILKLLKSLPNACPGIVITQHMPAGFTATFAERLNRQTSFNVREAQGGERIRSGDVFIAPGDKHLLVEKIGLHFYTTLDEGPAINRHKPAVDPLFQSVANLAGKTAVGILLTGMGKDGAKGLLDIKSQGGFTIAQDESSCIVYGMPKEAIELGAAIEVLPLLHIGPALTDLFNW